jgi:hypothetical protein
MRRAKTKVVSPPSSPGTLSKKEFSTKYQQLRRRIRAERLLTRREHNAERSLKAFRPRKVDRGQLHFIGTGGSRDAAKREAKGYLVYVDRNGQKSLVKQYDKQLRRKVIPKAQRLRDVEPFDSGKIRASRKFVNYTKTVFKQSFSTYSTGKVAKGNNFDSTSNLVNTLTREISTALGSRKSRRTFQVTIKCLVKDRKGKSHVIETSCKISRQDHVAIKKGGVKNFVQRKLYSFLSNELAQRGLVSEGSARHIRTLKVNRGKRKDKWVDNQGFTWEGHDRDVVTIQRTDYKIESIKI